MKQSIEYVNQYTGEPIKKKRSYIDVCILIILILYPMRHVACGLDLWDTGYNYANFRYMGTEHMDSMWLFSTYICNVVGHFMTLLPYGHTLIGMNVYTGLILSIIACIAYLFCTGDLGIHKAVVFVGEICAISLCWCPTALLYNYLTYLLYMLCVIFLYKGLTKGHNGMLVLAGVCLGLNLFVRVSNLPEASLILAVWLYAVLQSGKGKECWKRIGVYTGCCLGGYLAAVGVMLLIISIRYGFSNYVEGLKRLFAMTEEAKDYKATAMIREILVTYRDSLYWLIRIMFFAIVGFGLEFVSAKIKWLKGKKQKVLRIVIACMMTIVMVAWLLNRDFTSTLYRTYDPIFMTSILFLLYSMAVGAWLVIRPKSSKEDRLIGAFVWLVVFFTSVGSNNHVYPSMNNLFWIAPYSLWQSIRFAKYDFGKQKIVFLQNFSLTSFKMILFTMLGLFSAQAIMFGVFFTFAEATGAPEGNAVVRGNSVLAGVRMSEERAIWMQEISDFVAENHLEDQEVILYGSIPALSFYLQMPSAFNPWIDLDSYNVMTLQKDLEKMQREGIRPVIIQGIDQEDDEDQEKEETEENDEEVKEDLKWPMIEKYMEDNGYCVVFQNQRFILWMSTNP